jgi:hypothetical protein
MERLPVFPNSGGRCAPGIGCSVTWRGLGWVIFLKGVKMQTIFFEKTDQGAIVEALQQRALQIVEKKEQCMHCTRKATGVIIIMAVLPINGENQGHVVTVPVCKKHSKRTKHNDQLHKQVAADGLADLFGFLGQGQFFQV